MIKADASLGALVRRSRILECLSLGGPHCVVGDILAEE